MPLPATPAQAVACNEYFSGRFREKAMELIRFSVAVDATRAQQRPAAPRQAPMYDEDLVAFRYECGGSIQTISRFFMVGHRKVKEALAKRGVKLRSGTMTSAQRWALGERFIEEFNRGDSYQEIADRHGIAKPRIEYLLKDHPRRTRRHGTRRFKSGVGCVMVKIRHKAKR